jgi:hypothetical protein
LPSGEEFLIDREMRWARWLSVVTGVVCGLISWSLPLGLMAAVGARLGIEVMTLIWEEFEVLRGNDPYADRRAETEILHEERLGHKRRRDERRLALRKRCRRLFALARGRGRQGADRDTDAEAAASERRCKRRCAR